MPTLISRKIISFRSIAYLLIGFSISCNKATTLSNSDLEYLLTEKYSDSYATLKSVEYLGSINIGDKVEPIVKNRVKSLWVFDEELYTVPWKDKLLGVELVDVVMVKGASVEVFNIIISTRSGARWKHAIVEQVIETEHSQNIDTETIKTLFTNPRRIKGDLLKKSEFPPSTLVYGSDKYHKLNEQKESETTAKLEEEIRIAHEELKLRPRQIFISARTQERKYANYMSEWDRKVERVGNLNYPDHVRREGISGKLIMDVTLNADGTVQEISILRGSGHPVIDEAAVRIVNLAAPFHPFPPDILKDADILHITKILEFSSENRLKSH
ncbi:MAG: energy transducer TonB [Nitrosomonadaceae bacterium]